MSLSATLKTASSGLLASQIGLRTVSDNIANVNTPGYVRKTVDQTPVVIAGAGMGVQVSGVKRMTDQYLQVATLTATSDANKWDAISQYMDNAQSLFGDPASDTYFFGQMDEIFSAFSKAADDPSSSLMRSQAVANIDDFLGEAERINTQLDQLRTTVDARTEQNVNRANDLLGQINRLNADISRVRLSKNDASGSENIQSQLVDELATLMNVQVQVQEGGGVVVRSQEGYMLVGDGQAANLKLNRTDATKGYISIEPPGGYGVAQPIQVTGGQIAGLLQLRDVKIPGMSDQLGEFVARAADTLNAAHNASSAVPAPNVLTGRDTGLDLPTAVDHFTGKTTIAVTGKDGVVQSQVDIDFDAMTMSPGGGFDKDSFLTQLNLSLNGAATADFTGGTLSLKATDPDSGVAIDEGTSQKAGRGFSHFFGLNDLVRANGFSNYDTGLTLGDPNGFATGQTISFRLAQPDGKPLRDITVTLSGGGDMQDLLNQLNDPSAGVGSYGSFSLNALGQMTFKGTAPLNASLSVIEDFTTRGSTGGPAMSELFGIGYAERSTRANRMVVDKAIMSNPMKLGMAKLDLTVAVGKPSLTSGDGRGGRAISEAYDKVTHFSAAGEMSDMDMTLERYAAQFGGSIGRQSAAAETSRASAEAVANEATTRRQSVEGVNIDEELVRLTTYQQAFNASARMVQAANELFDTLVQMV